MQWPA
ncbi:hypothetical protein YPPY64_0658, partial [Yersinia pestis PY-64]